MRLQQWQRKKEQQWRRYQHLRKYRLSDIDIFQQGNQLGISHSSLVFAGWLSILKKRLVPTLRDAALLPDYSKVVERDL